MKEFIDLIQSLRVPMDELCSLGMELWDAKDQPEVARKALKIRKPKELKKEIQKNIALAQNILNAIADKVEEI